MGRVTLVGAGPGDASLITVKGLENLRKCDVVIYDRLSSEELLQEVPEDCIRVYVGKKPGAHSYVQEEINRILVEYAKKYDHVVRLKGGDSFVFGRGGEEIMALMEAGISFEVVPGITSAIAVPELSGIPVTHRGVSRSFHVITGHTKDGENTLTDDYETLAKLNGTLVFLMGLSNLEKIATQLMQHGKDKNTPAAVIAQGATPYERMVRGTLSDIAERVKAEGLTSPVIILIGAVADLHFKQERKQVFAVGTRRTLKEFAGQLEGKGGTVIPLIEMQVERQEGALQLEQEIDHISEYDWILFTSKQAVELFFSIFSKAEVDIRTLGRCRFGVIGEGTNEALKSHGIHAEFMPKRADAESFGHEFVKEVDGVGLKILLPRAAKGNPMLSEILCAAGNQVCDLPVYDVVAQRVYEGQCVDKDLVFFSASGVSAFFEELEAEKITLQPFGKIYCIGRQTKKALLEQENLAPEMEIIMAEEASVAALAHRVMQK